MLIFIKGGHILKKKNLLAFFLTFLLLIGNGGASVAYKAQNAKKNTISRVRLENYKANTVMKNIINKAQSGTNDAQEVNGNTIDLNFLPIDSVMDPNRPIIYAVSGSSNSVYSINYQTGEIKKVDFSLPPERITIANDKIYVTLLKMQHEYYTTAPLSGAVGIIDAATFNVSGQFDIDMDPYDIEADTNGNIYITPGSNQFGNLEVYSAATKQKTGQAGMTRFKSFIQYNPSNSKLYLITTDVSPRDISAYGFSQGSFKYLYDSPYNGDYDMDTNIRISPDGRYIFNGSGNIFNCSTVQSGDMTYAGKLSKPFTDVCFNSSKVFAGLSDGNIAVYDYSNFAYISTISTAGQVENLYFGNNSLISLSKFSDNSYGIEVINMEGSSTQLNVTGSYPEQGKSNIPVEGYIAFQFNKGVCIDTTKDILGDCTIKNYIVDKRTENNYLVLAYDNLNYNTNYNLKLNSAAIKDFDGNQLSGDFNLNFTTGQEFERLAGDTRYETSVAISKSLDSHSGYVVMATGENFPDALCSAPLAAKYEAPILLTNRDSIPAAVENEIDRLKTKEVFLVGGTGVITDNVKGTLEAKGIIVKRICGIDRYETSLEVAKFIDSPSKEAFVVTGSNYPDALSIASYAACNQIPILLTDKNSLTDNIKSYISTKGINKTYVIGGTGVISDDVLYSLPGSQRISGDNRYETNAEVLSNFIFYYGETFFATGRAFPDALSGAALAGAYGSPIILADDSMPDYIVDFLNENKDIMKMKKILGGTGAVSDTIINRIFK